MSTEITTAIGPNNSLNSREPAPRRVRNRPIAVIPRREFDYDVAIMGLGYVGLPTLLAMHAAGARVLGFDVSGDRIDVIRAGRPDLLESDHDRLVAARRSSDFALTADLDQLQNAAAVIVCVPTPIDEHATPDLGILAAACRSVVESAVAGQLLILTSTTYPGCSNDLLVEPLRKRGLIAGQDLHVAFSPERIDPGNDHFTHEQVPRIVGGVTEACARAAADLLGRYAQNVYTVSSLKVAEMAKLLENTFRAVNIALANEFAEACRALHVPVMEVISAAATKPYGFMPFYPGPGVGGHCIPCDPHYLLWELRKARLDLPVIEHAMSEIAARPRRVVERIRDILADHRTPLAHARVLVIGVAYKPDVADVRESPALDILSLLAAAGSQVGYVDPYIDTVTLSDGTRLDAEPDPSAFGADLIVIHTDHEANDLSWITYEHAVLDATYRHGELVHRALL